MGESWTINSDNSLTAFVANVKLLYEKHKYITYSKPRIGIDRSIDQNSLFHLWCSMWIAEKLGKHYKKVEKRELASMKRTVKKMFLIAHPESRDWMTQEITDYTTGQTKLDYTSSSDWKTGEMFMVLTFMQLEAANQGLILESTGEFAKNQREQNK